MKKKTFIIILILLILLMISLYIMYLYRSYSTKEEQQINNEYSAYYNQQKQGSDLISIINRTADLNNKNNVEKNEKGFYIENDTNSIKLYIGFTYENDTKVLDMERVINNGIESFLKVYSTAKFKCTEVTYHEKTKNVKSLTFVETEEWF